MRAEPAVPGGLTRPVAGEHRFAIGTGATILVALAAGVVTDVLAPRGPITVPQALLVIALAGATGIVAGTATRTRWSLVPAALAYAVAVELARLGGDVPSLDVRFDTVYGIIAFVLTRGMHGLLVLPPLAAGVAVGLVVAGRADARRPARRPVGTVLLLAPVVALVALVLWPASTPPIPGGGPGAIAELATVPLGGTDQTVLIRAADPEKPVLLYLSGGPGQSDVALSRVLAEPWVRDVVFVDLDQRGNGRSYPAIDPLSAMTLDRAVSDVIELTDYLRQRFDERKIYLMGESWGTILGVLAVQRTPERYHAWIGSGQMVDVTDTDRRIYADLVAYATSAHDDALLAKLAEIGTPPYRDIPWANSNLLAWYEYLYADYEPSAGYQTRGEASGLDPFGILGSEYSFVDKPNVLRGLIDTFAVMYPQLDGLDFRRTATRLEVPVYVLDGLAELRGRRDVMLEWFDELQAPAKERIEYAGAAHSVAFEQADAVRELLVDRIIPATYDR